MLAQKFFFISWTVLKQIWTDYIKFATESIQEFVSEKMFQNGPL